MFVIFFGLFGFLKGRGQQRAQARHFSKDSALVFVVHPLYHELLDAPVLVSFMSVFGLYEPNIDYCFCKRLLNVAKILNETHLVDYATGGHVRIEEDLTDCLDTVHKIQPKKTELHQQMGVKACARCELFSFLISWEKECTSTLSSGLVSNC